MFSHTPIPHRLKHTNEDAILPDLTVAAQKPVVSLPFV